MRICVIAQGYPYPGFPQFPFVEQLCNAIADLGHQVVVVAPQSLTNKYIRRHPLIPYYRKFETGKGGIVEIFTPKYLTIGTFPVLGDKINYGLFNRSVVNTLKGLNGKYHFDLCYGHFWYSAYAAFPFCQKNNIPLFVASGESVIQINHIITQSKLRSLASYISGVICVSTKNKMESIQKCFVDEEKCKVFPNSIDSSLFYFKDKKEELRAKFGFSNSDFIVAFTGAFIHRKGAKRVSDALTQINDPNIKAIFIGAGSEEEPNYNRTIFKGRVEHDLIPDYLNCADIFVLPTLKEGCCNAIVEALACGLPIVSSDELFNYDILDKSNSILVNPLDVDGIKNAIISLKEDSNLYCLLSQGALHQATDLNIVNRALRISEFIKQNINNN